MYNLLDDLTVVTNIGRFNYEELANKSVAIISHNVEESLRDDEIISTIDIGIGQLNIYHTSDEIKYKFIPSKKLDDTILNTCKTRKSQLAITVDNELGRRLSNTYKGLI